MAAVPTAHDINVKPRTGDVLIEENLDFRGLLLSESIQQGLEKGGFQRPSPIQLKAIPLGRCGLDLIVQAKSGTGKTCVFSVIALDGVILDSLATQVLVLAPTREIAVQICDVINSIGSCMKGLQCLTFIGGTPLSVDRQKLARCHIAVGTPGRIKQLIEEKILPTSNIRLFVLDEADKLLEDSFQEQINWIFSSLPDNKQMLALSATYPEVLAQHLTAYMRNPTFLRLNVTDPALLGIRQYYKQVEFHPLANKLFDRKTDALLELLSTVEFHQCLVFSNFQMRAESLSEVLNFRGWPATYISGSREQQDRMAAMASLKQMTCRVLISTDLTSRGIDAENVNLIINLDLPPNHETYLHRIGRAGRFGTYGAGVSFVADGKEMEELKRLEKACNTTVKPLPDPIPTDLARSSGFVSLEHLVTTETIITQKEGVDIKSSKVPMPQLVKKDAKPQDAGSPAKPVVTSSDNGQLRSKPDDAKSNGTKSKAEPQQLNGSNGKVVDGSEKNKDTSEIPTVAVPKDTRLPPTDAVQTGAKPKWKTNNVWTNLSFSYGAECQQMDDQRKKGKLTHAGPGDQRRNEGPKKDSAHSPKKCVAKENGVRNGVENSITAVKESGENKFVQKSRKEPTLTMPSLKDIRGSPCQLRPFSEIMEDFANITVKGESIPEKKEDQQETTKCFALSMQYLENVSRLLKELSEKEKALQKSPCPAMPATNPLPTPGMSTTQQGEPCKKVQSEKHVQLQSAKTVKVQSEPQAVPCKMEPKYEPKPSCRTENVSCTGETGTETTIEKEAPNKPGVEKVSAENMAGARKETTHKSWDRSGTRGKKKSPVTLSVGSTMERLMTNYETLNESNKDQASGVHQMNTTSPQAIHPNKPKPSKSKKRVDPYGAWEPYVAPEPPTPVAEQYKSPEITDDEDSDGTPEDLESDWESSSISCEEEDVYDGVHAGRNRRRSSAKPTQMGYEHTPSPCFTSPADYVAYQNAWMAQQAVFYTSACYQQYMLHLQYAEYYRQQLKAQQHAACDMDSLYASHKKYIRKMAKWLAKHNPDE